MCLIFILVFAVIDDTTKEIVYRDYVDISVAVATPKVRQTGAVKGSAHRWVTGLFSQGLVVPVIRNVEGMNFADIEKTINLLGEKVISGYLLPSLT